MNQGNVQLPSSNIKKPSSATPGMKQEPGAGGPPKGNAKLILAPSKKNPSVRRWINPQEEAENVQLKKPEQQSEQRERFKLHDRIAFQTKQQMGTAEFTFGQIVQESDNYFAILDDNDEKYAIPKKLAISAKQAMERKIQEKEAAEKEDRPVRTSDRTERVEMEVDEPVREKPVGSPEYFVGKKGEIWQAVQVGSFVDYVKLGKPHSDAEVLIKYGEQLAVVNQDGSNDTIHRNNITNLKKGVNTSAVDKYMARMEKHFERIEKRLSALQLENKDLKKYINQVAKGKNISPENQEKINQEKVRYKAKADMLERKVQSLTLKIAKEEEKRLEILSLSKKEKEELKTKLTDQRDKLKSEIGELKEKQKQEKDKLNERFQERKEEGKKLLTKQNVKLKDEFKKLVERHNQESDQLQEQLKAKEDEIDFLKRTRQKAKEEVSKFQGDIGKYRQQLEDLRKEIDQMENRDYNLVLEHLNNSNKKKAKYDFSGIDFDSIDFQHAMDVMFENLPKQLKNWRKDETWNLIKTDKTAFFDRMLNFAKRHYPQNDDLTAIQKTFGSNWMMEGLDEGTLGRVRTLDEGDYDMYDEYGPDNEEVEAHLEDKNNMAFEKALKSMKMDSASLSDMKAGSDQYNEFVDEVVKSILADGATRADIFREIYGKDMDEGMQEQELPEEAMYDPTDNWAPTELDWKSVEWHEENFHENYEHLNEKDKKLYDSIERTEDGQLDIYPDLLYEELEPGELEEIHNVLNTVYAEQNYELTQDRAKQDMSEVLATAQMLTNRAIQKAKVRSKDEKELEKLKEKTAAVEREFLDKYLYKKSVLFGLPVLIRNKVRGMKWKIHK